MSKLDEMIREALEGEEREAFEAMSEPGYFNQGIDLFRGHAAWVNWVVMLVQSVMFLIAVWAGWHFFAASELLVALKWGLSAATLAIVATVMKLSLIPVMQANRVLRELKRVELMLASDRAEK